MEKANRIKQLLTIGLAVVLVASSLFVSMPVDVFADEPLIESEQKLQEKSEEKSQEKTQHSINEAEKDVGYEVSVKADSDMLADEPSIESADNSQKKSQEKSEEETQDKPQEKSEDKSQYSINESVKDGGYEVSVKADPGVYPSDARVTVSRITKRTDIENAIAKEDENAEVVVAFDIKVVDESGNEIEPNNEAGSIYVSIKSSEIDENSNYEVYHVDEQKMEAKAMDADVVDGEVVEFETTHFSVYVLTKDDSYGGQSPTVKIELLNDNGTQIELRKGTSGSGTLLDSGNTNNVTLSNGDELFVKYLFLNEFVLGKESGDPYLDIANMPGKEDTPILLPGKIYELPQLPEWFDSSSLTDIDIAPAGQTAPFGTVKFSGRTVSFVTASDFSALPYKDSLINNTFAGFHAKFIADKTGDTNESQTISWSDSGPSFKINNSYYEEKAPKIEKEVNTADISSGKLKWKVTLTQAAYPKSYINPYFEDIYSTEGQTLVTDSIVVKKNTTTLGSSLYTIDTLVAGKIEIKLNDPLSANDKVTIEYETNVTDAALLSGTEFKNHIKYNDGDDTLICEAKKNYKFDSGSKSWIAKTGIRTDLTTGEMIWKIEVHTNGFKFNTLTLFDKMTAGSYKEGGVTIPVELQFDGFVSTTDEIAFTSESDTYYAGTKSDASNPSTDGYNWKYEWDSTGLSNSMWDTSTPGDKVMTLYYRTKVANLEKFKKLITLNANKLPENEAFLKYTFPTGTVPPGSPIGEPSVSKPYGLTGVQIKKTAKGFNYGTREFTWEITVNENEVSLTNVHVIETIGDYQDKEYIQIDGFTVNNDSPASNTYNDTQKSDGIYNICLGDITTKKVITVKTRMTEDEFKAICTKNDKDSGKNKYINKAKLNNPELEVQAKQSVEGEVFKKSKSAYDYDKHVVTWQFDINNKKIAMADVKVTDDLAGKKMSLYDTAADAVSISIDSGAFSDLTTTAGSDGRYYKYENGILTVYAGSLENKKAVVKVKAKIDDSLYIKEAMSVSNDAKLDFKYGDDDFEQDGNATCDFTNNIISKKKDSISGNTIKYHIDLNTAQMDVGGMEVTDTLGSGLIYNEASITLKKATVNSSTGALTAVGEPVSISKNISTNSDGCQMLKFNLPPGNSPYILTYSVLVINPDLTTVTNKASISGYASEGEETNSFSVDSGTFSGAGLSEIYKLVIEKKDNLGNPLSGAKFKVKLGGESSDYVSGTDGLITVYYFSKPSADITVEEIEAPAGYDRGEVYSATINKAEWDDASDKKITKSFVNKKKPSITPAPKPKDPDDNDGGKSGGGSTPPPIVPIPPVPTPSVPPVPSDALTPNEYPSDEPIVILGIDPNSGYIIVYTEELPDGFEVEEYNDEYDIIRQINTGKVLGVIKKGVLGARNKRSPKTGELPVVPVAIGIIAVLGIAVLILERKRKK